jgi:hypothetical protein
MYYFIFLCLATISWPALVKAGDREALECFFNATGGQYWVNRANWISNADIITWFGVTNATGSQGPESIYVHTPKLSLYLEQNNLTGDIGTALRCLVAFSVSKWIDIELAQNRLSGAVSPQTLLQDGIFSLMEVFSIGNNKISGNIPFLSKNSFLYNFDARNNDLSGSIPDLISTTNLWFFRVSGNRLTGPIPNLETLYTLWTADFSNNSLTGPFPVINRLPYLQIFDISYNNISGRSTT